MKGPFSYVYQFYGPYIPRPYIMDNPMYRYSLSRTNPIQIKTQEIHYSDEYIKADLKYPEIDGLEDKKVQSFINNSIKNDIMEFKNQMERAAKEAAEEARRNGEEFKPFVISSVYEVTYNKNNLLSISIVYHQYINGRNSYIKTSYNFNLMNGESMSLKDLFKEGVDYRSIINKEVRKELILNREKYFPDTLENFKGIAEYHPFYIDDNGIDIYFGFHEIAPIASDIPIIHIPFSALRNYMKPRYLR
ncbi:DUF3298 and DUF4163 domain-containing protein [Wukongibacter baidiensis]|uniref:DUF3298 and DUF4163 domain-containing protein n=1 Tax=Wukongibacter baidiensis TaxID=1723361 RepID=UPI003D7FDACC